MSPPDFDPSPKLKEPMRGQRFQSLEALNAAVTRRYQFNSGEQLMAYKNYQSVGKMSKGAKWITLKVLNVSCVIN
jgi:hypothetical protein